MFRTCLIAALFWCATFGKARAEGPPPRALESFEAAWEIIRDTHFDTNFNGLDWNKVHAEFLPKIEKARSDDEVRETIQAMMNKLGHSHMMVIPGSPPSSTPSKTAAAAAPPKNEDRPQNGSLGIEVRVLNGQIVVFRLEPRSSAAEAGIKPGWIIRKIDDESALDPTIPETGVSARQREFLLWHYAVHALKGAVGDECALVVDDSNGKERTLKIPYLAETGMPAKLGNLPLMFTRTETNDLHTALGKRVGYLRFNLWMLPAIQVIDRFVENYRNADGIIIDLRGNLGGIGGMVMGAAGHFVNERASLGTMKLRDNELNFLVYPRRVDLHQQPTNTVLGKLAIITDAVSLSSAELFAGGMQELGRARLFGEPTGGQALPSVSDRLPNGDLFYHAIADFTTPKGLRLEGNGVKPDELVPLKLESLRAGKDEPVAAALRWIE